MRTRKMLRAFLKTCRAVQLLHACVVKFKVSGTVYTIVLEYSCEELFIPYFGKVWRGKILANRLT